MRVPIIYQIGLFLLLAACKQEKKNAIQVPDMKPNFLARLSQRDSTLLLDSFYLLGTDSINEKEAHIGQKLPLMVILSSVNRQLDTISARIKRQKVPEALDIEKQNELSDEKRIIISQIDSLDRLIASNGPGADVGYAVFYKVTVTKPHAFTTSDTVIYVITQQRKIVDWDRSVEKSIDSIVVGKHYRPYNEVFKELSSQ